MRERETSVTWLGGVRITVMAVCVALAACSGIREERVGVTRSVRVGGSTTLYPALAEGATLFMAANPDFKIVVTKSSSGSGVEQLLAGELDVAAASRVPLMEEFDVAKQRKIALKTYLVALDAIGVIVHPDLYPSISGLTRAQVFEIFFGGEISKWGQLDDRLTDAINAYGRQHQDSGTAEGFTKHVAGTGGEPYVASVTLIDQTDLIVSAVAGDRAGIGFVSISLVDETVRVVDFGLDEQSFVKPSIANIRNLDYPLRRDLYLLTNGTPRGPLNDFIRFMLSPQGQGVFERHGMISIY